MCILCIYTSPNSQNVRKASPELTGAHGIRMGKAWTDCKKKRALSAYFKGSGSKIHYNDIKKVRTQNLGMSEHKRVERDIMVVGRHESGLRTMKYIHI